MACLLVLVVAAAVLTAPPGKQLTHAARTTSPEAFWRATLPDAPMPESIRELLRPSSEVNPPNADVTARGDDPPPMNFNYDDYRGATSAKAPEHAVGTRNAATDVVVVGSARASSAAAAAAAPAVFFLEDEVRVGGSLPFRRAATDNGEAAAAAAGQAQPLPLELYTIRAVRAVEGSSFVACRGEPAGGGDAVYYACRGVVGPARAYVVDVVGGERGDAVTATVVCHDADGGASSNCDLERAAFRLLDVKPGGGGAAVCYAVPDWEMLLVKSDKVSSSA